LTEEIKPDDKNVLRGIPIQTGEKFILFIIANLVLIETSPFLIENLLVDELDIDGQRDSTARAWSPIFLGNVFRLRA
jgi:hypothetical protein